VIDAEGRPIPGPNVPWKGRRHGRRADRRPGTAWTPEQISHRLRVDFPEDESMRIGHETIYQALYVQVRGALRRDLSACRAAARGTESRVAGRARPAAAGDGRVARGPGRIGDCIAAGMVTCGGPSLGGDRQGGVPSRLHAMPTALEVVGACLNPILAGHRSGGPGIPSAVGRTNPGPVHHRVRRFGPFR
jgi:hypothetical protein